MRLIPAGRPVPLVAAALLGTLLAAAPAAAQDYPTRPIRLIVPTAAGGGTDLSARMIAPKLSQLLGQQVVVENIAGGNTAVGVEHVAKAAPDGYTLLMGISSITINPHTQVKVPYDPIRDFEPISQVVTVPLILASHPSLPVRNLKELLAFVRKHPGQLNYGTGSVGSNPHLAMELFLAMTGTRVTHIPYRGQGPAITDLVAGHIELSMANLLALLPHYRANRVRAHGVSSQERSQVAPDVPTIAEAGVPGYDVVQWFGVLAPARTPQPIIEKLHASVVKALQDPAVRKNFIARGADTVGNTPAQLGAIMRADLKKWGELVKKAGIRPGTR